MQEASNGVLIAMINENEKNIIASILSIPAEDRCIEFKRFGDTDVTVSKIIQTLVAMANTDGGFIFCGIDDPEKTKCKGSDRVYGIEENLEMFDEIGREIARIVPPLAMLWPPLKIEIVKGKTIGIISVPKVGEHIHTFNDKVYVRLEKGNKILTPPEIIKYSYARGFIKADRELVDVDFDLLDTEIFHSWRRTRKIQTDNLKNVLFQTGLAAKDTNGVLKPTRAAVLLFALYPHTLMDTKSAIRVYQYEGSIEKMGNVPNLIGKPKTIEGPLIKLIEEAQEYVLTLLQSGITIPSSGFINKYRIPERAVKEAITNAVIHRDYFIKRDIEINIYEDRLEIVNAGLFSYNITPSNIGFVRADGYRNDLLVKHLREFPDPPNLDRNEGVRAMREEMAQSDLYPPVYVTYPIVKDAVWCVLRNAKKASEWDKVYSYLSKKSKYVSNQDIRGITGNADTIKVSRLLKKWVDNGLLLKIDTGSKKSTKYRLPSGEMVDFLFADPKSK